MPMNLLEQAKVKTIGTKQTLKAIQTGNAQVVFIADDAEIHVTKPLLQLCEQQGLEIIKVPSMVELGKACGIKVKAASAAIVKE
ncbi:MAG: ribosomal L7Ae/L30e/S12e/Gadd45 family protein [Bacillota bacterium]|nr:ribosomal L7Ae/L30e/S12e/Gadd45 family protein [Bacillota bacterium]